MTKRQSQTVKDVLITIMVLAVSVVGVIVWIWALIHAGDGYCPPHDLC
ncbi:hypothetical protein ACIRVF_41880 [Kitasatospora sp. NPDC101157]